MYGIVLTLHCTQTTRKNTLSGACHGQSWWSWSYEQTVEFPYSSGLLKYLNERSEVGTNMQMSFGIMSWCGVLKHFFFSLRNRNISFERKKRVVVKMWSLLLLINTQHVVHGAIHTYNFPRCTHSFFHSLRSTLMLTMYI